MQASKQAKQALDLEASDFLAQLLAAKSFSSFFLSFFRRASVSRSLGLYILSALLACWLVSLVLLLFLLYFQDIVNLPRLPL